MTERIIESAASGNHRILLEEWAYIRPWTSERQRVAGYQHFTHFYDQHRSHGALGWQSPWPPSPSFSGDDSPPSTARSRGRLP